MIIIQVFSIRDAAANNLKRLAEEFGPEWAMQHIVPQVCFYPLSFYVSEICTIRLLVLGRLMLIYFLAEHVSIQFMAFHSNSKHLVIICQIYWKV